MSVKELTQLKITDLLNPLLGDGVSAQTVANIAKSLVWARKWKQICPKAVRCIEKDLEELLNFYHCPKQMRIKLRTTNVIERAFREVRRRTRPMSCFNHDQSIERIVYSVLSRLNEQWGRKPLKEFTHKS